MWQMNYLEAAANSVISTQTSSEKTAGFVTAEIWFRGSISLQHVQKQRESEVRGRERQCRVCNLFNPDRKAPATQDDGVRITEVDGAWGTEGAEAVGKKIMPCEGAVCPASCQDALAPREQRSALGAAADTCQLKANLNLSVLCCCGRHYQKGTQEICLAFSTPARDPCSAFSCVRPSASPEKEKAVVLILQLRSWHAARPARLILRCLVAVPSLGFLFGVMFVRLFFLLPSCGCWKYFNFFIFFF